MPQNTPRPPKGVLALLAAPLLWQTQCPDLFDSFTAGMVLLQMSVPQLRKPGSMKVVNSQLKSLGNDAEAWRERYVQLNLNGPFSFRIGDLHQYLYLGTLRHTVVLQRELTPKLRPPATLPPLCLPSCVNHKV